MIKDAGFTLKDLIKCLDEYQEKGCTHSLSQAYDDWCAERGFSGEIFVCESEYYTNDFFEYNLTKKI